MVVLVLIVIAAIVSFKFLNQPNKNSSQNTKNTITATNTPIQSSAYKDGSYTEVGNYVSPGGPETIKVEVTLKNGVVKEINVTPQATRPTSKEKQEDFAANYKPMVIGKNIDEVMLVKVSGSSLTPKGFNDAIKKIKVDAKI